MVRIETEVLRALESGQRIALVTLIDRQGSAPAPLGSKLAVFPGVRSLGTIGGGCLEAEAWQVAHGLLRTGGVARHSWRLTADQMAGSGMICGGRVEILAESFDAAWIPFFQALQGLVENRVKGLIVTRLPAAESTCDTTGKALWRMEGGHPRELLYGFPPNGYWEALPDRCPQGVEVSSGFLLGGSTADFLWEPLNPAPELFLFGAGHISQRIAALAAQADFRVSVIDDREAFANQERFPEADQVLVRDFETALEGLRLGPDSAIAILTRGHLHDSTVLEQAVRTGAGYIGMIGSPEKIAIIYRQLREKGIPPEALHRVHAPIGLAIGAQTIDEIALSIAAELVSWRRLGETAQTRCPQPVGGKKTRLGEAGSGMGKKGES
ncbi:MAG: XdhC family protein [Coprothermobacterota bacterium]|nr:XdhC family protein [Coprothermobacterota bacterium]